MVHMYQQSVALVELERQLLSADHPAELNGYLADLAGIMQASTAAFLTVEECDRITIRFSSDPALINTRIPKYVLESGNGQRIFWTCFQNQALSERLPGLSALRHLKSPYFEGYLLFGFARAQTYHEELTARLEITSMWVSNAMEHYFRQRTLRKDAQVARIDRELEHEFKSRLSHDLRTPLNGILSALSLIEEDEGTLSRQDLLSIAMKSAESLLQQLNTMLPPPDIQPRKAAAGPHRALILEDNPFNQKLLARILDQLHIPFQLAASLEEARILTATAAFTVALLDVHLPDGFGDEYARELKAQHPEMSIYLVTADVGIDKKIAELSAIHGWIFKPYKVDAIREIFS